MDGILKAVLRDEIIAWHKKTQEDTSMPLSPAGQPENMDSQQLVSLVQKAVTAIMTRLHNLAQFEGGESKVNTLVAAANSLDNLCRMDPAWHPWLWEGSTDLKKIIYIGEILYSLAGYFFPQKG